MSIALGLSKVQQRNLQDLILGLIHGSNGQCLGTARTIGRRSHSTYSRFLNQSAWDHATALRKVAIRIIENMKPQAGEAIYLIIDDTKIAKRCRITDAASTLHDHASNSFIHGHQVVMAWVVFRGVRLPWAMQLWLPKKFCRKHGLSFLRSTDIAAQMIREFKAFEQLEKVALFDSFYLCAQVTFSCLFHDFSWISIAKSNRNLTVNNSIKKLSRRAPGLLRGASQHIKQRRRHGNRTVRCATIEKGYLNRIGFVKTLLIQDVQKKTARRTIAVVSNRRNWCNRSILERYSIRWQIEVGIKELKGAFGLEQYQVQQRSGIERHLHLSALAYATITRRAVKRLGVKAQQPNMDVHLPGLQERLHSFCRDHEDRCLKNLLWKVKRKSLQKKLLELFRPEESDIEEWLKKELPRRRQTCKNDPR
jgi:SRSO17 transposase